MKDPRAYYGENFVVKRKRETRLALIEWMAAYVLQMEEGGEDEAYIFRVGDDHRIEHVEDEDEWERAAEAVDELLFYDEN